MIPFLPKIERDAAGGITDSGKGAKTSGGSPFHRDVLRQFLLGTLPKAVASPNAEAPTLSLGSGGSVTTILDLLIPASPPVLK